MPQSLFVLSHIFWYNYIFLLVSRDPYNPLFLIIKKVRNICCYNFVILIKSGVLLFFYFGSTDEKVSLLSDFSLSLFCFF